MPLMQGLPLFFLWEISLAQKEDFDPVMEILAELHIAVDTSSQPELCIQAT